MLAGDKVWPAWGHWRKDMDERSTVLRLLTGLGEEAAAELNGRSAAEWLDELFDDPAARAFAASVLRTATYTGDHSLLDAGAAARQLRAAAQGVLYLHGGWSSLVEGLVDVVRASGGVIRTRAAVAAVEHDHPCGPSASPTGRRWRPGERWWR